MVVSLSFFGPDLSRVAELLKVLVPPIHMPSRPFFGNNYTDIELVSSNGRARFFVRETYTAEDFVDESRVEFVDFEVSQVSEAEQPNATIGVYAQVMFNEVEPDPPKTIGIYNFTTYFAPLLSVSGERSNIVISGFSIRLGEQVIDLCLSSYEEALVVDQSCDSRFWARHTLLGIVHP
jgi:hypothetical protein